MFFYFLLMSFDLFCSLFLIMVMFVSLDVFDPFMESLFRDPFILLCTR